MKITNVRAIPLSDAIPPERQHRTDLGTKIKSDAVLIPVGTAPRYFDVAVPFSRSPGHPFQPFWEVPVPVAQQLHAG